MTKFDLDDKSLEGTSSMKYNEESRLRAAKSISR